jgi:hypothetical protein
MPARSSSISGLHVSGRRATASTPDHGQPRAWQNQLRSHDQAGQKVVQIGKAQTVIWRMGSDVGYSSSASRSTTPFRGRYRPRPVLLRQLMTSVVPAHDCAKNRAHFLLGLEFWLCSLGTRPPIRCDHLALWSLPEDRTELIGTTVEAGGYLGALSCSAAPLIERSAGNGQRSCPSSPIQPRCATARFDLAAFVPAPFVVSNGYSRSDVKFDPTVALPSLRPWLR